MKKQVIIADYGGPEKASEVKHFLLNMFKDKRILSMPVVFRYPLGFLIANLRSKKSSENYKKIGFSPVKRNINKLCEKLNANQNDFQFVKGFRYMNPFLSEMTKEKSYEDAIIFPVFPHSSFSTYKSIEDVASAGNSIIAPYYKSDQFLDLLKIRIENGLSKFNGKTGVLLTAHSIPESFVKNGDIYVDQIKEQVQLIANLFDNVEIQLGFQSPLGPVKWVGPFLDEALENLKEKKCKNILALPLSFTVDNSETLLDLDTDLKNMVHCEYNLNYFRIPCLNFDDDYCEFIINYIRKHHEKNTNS